MTPLSILYVDDDPDIRVIVATALSLDSSIRLRVAGSGGEALKMVAAGDPPDVAVLDVMMPGMDGPALMAQFAAVPEMKDVPVIFMTAKARQADVALYRAKGARGVILKPFDPLTLAANIRGILAEAVPPPTA